MYMFVLYYLHLFFYSVPTKVAEVRASVAVVDRVLQVEKCFSQMLTDMRQQSAELDIKNVRFFLESILEADEFNTCKGFEDVLRLLRKSYIDAFNTSYLEQLVEYLKIKKISQLMSDYKSKRDAFFKESIVIEFQDAVFNKVEPLSGEDEVKVPEVRVPRSLVNKRTQRDMETLATQFCGSYRKPVVQMDDVPVSKNVTSKWPVYIAVLLGITTILFIILAIYLKINSSSEMENLNQEVKGLRAQLTQCQNEEQKMKEEVKNLTEEKGRFLERSNSLAAKRTDDFKLLDLLSNRTAEDGDKLLKCENRYRNLEAEVHKLLLNDAQMTRKYDKCYITHSGCREDLDKCVEEYSACSYKLKECENAKLLAEDRERNQNSLRHSCNDELTKCNTKHEKLVLNNTQIIRERDQYSFNYSACSNQLTSYEQLRKNVSMLESENDKLAKNCAQCSERLTTCQESCQLYSFLYSRKCFKVMRGHVELICQPIFVM